MAIEEEQERKYIRVLPAAVDQVIMTFKRKRTFNEECGLPADEWLIVLP